MDSLDQLLDRLPARHRESLNWFRTHTGVEVAWPARAEFGGEPTHVATKAKGIYKPTWTQYALSVRQVLGGRYPDQDPVVRENGSWIYAYFQENENPEARDSEYTNAGMMACLRDRVPVGVMRQTKAKPGVRYLVLGVALVASWDGGYFFLEGFSSSGLVSPASPSAELEFLAVGAETLQQAAGDFDPTSVIDGRQRVVAQIVRRRGQPEFRRNLLKAYDGRCAVTACDAADALEAAHIVPYRGEATHHPSNGVLLRADVHSLFDLGLISVDSTSMTVRVSDKLLGTIYRELNGRSLTLPSDPGCRPSSAALDLHRSWSRL